MNIEQAWLLFQRTGLPEAYSLYRELREHREELAEEIAPPEAGREKQGPASGGRR